MKVLCKTALGLIFILYILVLTKMILFKHLTLQQNENHFILSLDRDYWSTDNFVPLKTISFYLLQDNVSFRIRVLNLAGNIIGFLPFGFLLPLILRKSRSFLIMTTGAFLLSLLYESLQLQYNLGSFDVDDIILNTFGGMLGYIPAKLLMIAFSWLKGRHEPPVDMK